MGALTHCKSDDPAARYLNPLISVLKNEAAHKDWIYVGQHSSASVPTARFRNANTSGESLVAYAQDASTKILAASNTGVTFGGATTTTGLATFDGNVVANGNVTLGNAAGDTVTVNATSTFAAAATFNGGLTTTTLTANGNVILGDAAADTITVNGTTTFKEAVTIAPTAGGGNDQSLFLKHNSGAGQFSLGATNSATPDLIFKNNGGTQIARMFTGGGLLVGSATALTSTEQLEVSTGGLRVQAGGIVLAGSGNIDGNSGTAGQIRIGGLIANAASFDGSEKLLVNGTSRLKGQVVVTTGGLSVTGSTGLQSLTAVGTAAFTGDFSVQVGANTMLDIRSAGVGFNGKAGQAPPNYTLTNYTSDRRTLDMTSGTATEVREFLCTLANDLIDKTGILS